MGQVFTKREQLFVMGRLREDSEHSVSCEVGQDHSTQDKTEAWRSRLREMGGGWEDLAKVSGHLRALKHARIKD